MPFPSTFTASGKALRRHPPSQSWGTFDIQSLEMGIKHYKRSGFAHWNELTPVCHHANAITRAGRCSGFLSSCMSQWKCIHLPSVGVGCDFTKWPQTTRRCNHFLPFYPPFHREHFYISHLFRVMSLLAISLEIKWANMHAKWVYLWWNGFSVGTL